MKFPSCQKGQNLIEALLALGIFMIFVIGSLTLGFRYWETHTRVEELNQVQAITEESFEALQSIVYDNWSAISDGTYGLNSLADYWQFQAEPDLIDNKYTRTITISSARRDADCQIIESGGTEDPDTKLMTVNISWQGMGAARNKSSRQFFTNWSSPAACLAGSGGEAGNLTIDVSQARIDATKKSLIGVELINNRSVAITLDKMTLTWTKPGNILFIKIEGQNYWHYSAGVGSPQGAQPSGTELDLVDLVLAPGEDYEVDNFRFDDKVDGSTFTITIIMSDGTSKTVVTTPPFVP